MLLQLNDESILRYETFLREFDRKIKKIESFPHYIVN